jgi:hypothetical protein
MIHTFRQHQSLKNWLEFRVREQQCLLGILYIQENEPDMENKEEVCEQLRRMAEESNRNVMREREIYFDFPRI